MNVLYTRPSICHATRRFQVFPLFSVISLVSYRNRSITSLGNEISTSNMQLNNFILMTDYCSMWQAMSHDRANNMYIFTAPFGTNNAKHERNDSELKRHRETKRNLIENPLPTLANEQHLYFSYCNGSTASCFQLKHLVRIDVDKINLWNDDSSHAH